MRLHEILTEGQRASFRLHPALNPTNYVMTDSIADYDMWRAMTYVCNNAGSDETLGKGDLYEVGYIMISLVDDTIIPISRLDEHHMGRDVLYSLARKYKFSDGDYLPIWPGGNNYIYNKSEIEPLRTALSKFLSYGGGDGMVCGTSDMRGVMMTASQFVESGGDVEIKPGEIAPVGKMILAQYTQLANALAAARGDARPSTAGAAFKTATNVARMHVRFLYDIEMSGSMADTQALVGQVRDLQKENDLQGLSALFFGHIGVKNRMHGALKQAYEKHKRGEWVFGYDKTEAIWGDIPLAIDMLGRF